MTRSPPAPSHLREQSRKWYRSVVRDYTLEPHHLKLLQAAAECWDRLCQARERLAQDGLVVTGSEGALIQGPGGPRSDSIVARVSPGEYIVNAAATKKNRRLLDAINNGINTPHFANGGQVGVPSISVGTTSAPVIQTSARTSSAPIIHQSFDLRGAVVTEQLLAQMNQTASKHASEAVRMYDRKVIPARVSQLIRDPRRRF